MKDIKSLLIEKFKDKEFEKSYYRTAAFFRLADELLLLRKKRGVTQNELAERAGTTQAVVSRFENASVKASLESIVKLAEALDAIVDVRLIPVEDIRQQVAEKEKTSRSNMPNDALQGIVYYRIDELAEKHAANWFDPTTISDDLSILDISSHPPLNTIKKNQKIREYA